MSRFLLVSLNIDAILQETTIHRRRQKLNAMTDGLGLGDAFGTTLDRIKGQGGERARLGMATLMWVSHAERPLKADELLHALAVGIGSPNFNSDNIPPIGTLLSCCQGLVVIDKEASTVRLIHFTLQEYLRAHPEIFGTAHSTMAEACLSYLNSQQVQALSTIPSPDLQSVPFLKYSSLYWGVHAKRELSDCAKQLALKLFDDCGNHMSTKVLLRAQRWGYYRNIGFNVPSLFSGLHWASFFGIDEIVTGLVEAGDCDINKKDRMGNTPLIWAVLNGHEGVVKILLGRGDINPERPGISALTPLCCAAENGHEGVVRILLGRGDVNPEKPDIFGKTPLWYAADSGHERVVRILLGRDDVDPEKPGKFGQTPLCCAAEHGHEGMVKILLQRDDVDPERLGEFGQTPLCWAAQNGHEGVVKILLERDDVNPEKSGKFGQTPLCCAAECGHEGVVKILLERNDVNPEKPGKFGQTPLRWAAQNGHEEVVRILPRRSDVNSNKPDGNGRPPLSRVFSRGHAGAVALLPRLASTTPARPKENWPLPPLTPPKATAP